MYMYNVHVYAHCVFCAHELTYSHVHYRTLYIVHVHVYYIHVHVHVHVWLQRHDSLHHSYMYVCLMPSLVLCFLLLTAINLYSCSCHCWICILILLSPTFNVSSTDTLDYPLLRLLLTCMCMCTCKLSLIIVIRGRCSHTGVCAMQACTLTMQIVLVTGLSLVNS